MWRVYGGAIAVIAGIAAFTEASTHRPILACVPNCERVNNFHDAGVEAWSATTYDLVHIAAWALVILGALTLVLGLIRYWRSASRPTGLST